METNFRQHLFHLSRIICSGVWIMIRNDWNSVSKYWTVRISKKKCFHRNEKLSQCTYLSKIRFAKRKIGNNFDVKTFRFIFPFRRCLNYFMYQNLHESIKSRCFFNWIWQTWHELFIAWTFLCSQVITGIIPN